MAKLFSFAVPSGERVSLSVVMFAPPGDESPPAKWVVATKAEPGAGTQELFRFEPGNLAAKLASPLTNDTGAGSPVGLGTQRTVGGTLFGIGSFSPFATTAAYDGRPALVGGAVRLIDFGRRAVSSPPCSLDLDAADVTALIAALS